MIAKIFLEIARISAFITLMFGWLLAFTLHKVNGDPALSISLAIFLCAAVAGGVYGLEGIASSKIDIWRENIRIRKETSTADKLIAISSFIGAMLLSGILIFAWVYSGIVTLSS